MKHLIVGVLVILAGLYGLSSLLEGARPIWEQANMQIAQARGLEALEKAKQAQIETAKKQAELETYQKGLEARAGQEQTRSELWTLLLVGAVLMTFLVMGGVGIAIALGAIMRATYGVKTWDPAQTAGIFQPGSVSIVPPARLMREETPALPQPQRPLLEGPGTWASQGPASYDLWEEEPEEEILPRAR